MASTGAERVVKSAAAAYVDPEGNYRHALRGETVFVHPDKVARFDELDGQDAPAPAVAEAPTEPVERYAPVVETEKRGPGRPRKDGS